LRITSLDIENYRTFENIQIEFKGFYSAICGQNDAGKSNIVRVLRAVLQEESILFTRLRRHKVSVLRDYPKWKDSDEKKHIKIKISFLIHKDSDAGIYEFLSDYLGLEFQKEEVELSLSLSWHDPNSENNVNVVVDGKEFDGIKAQEVHNKLQASILIHNSTEIESRPSFTGYLSEFSEQYIKELDDIAATVTKSLKKIAKNQKEEVARLLANLNSKLKVGITLPDFSLDRLPYNLTLGDSKIEVNLNDWGSGTKNRTMIFLTLLKARQISESVTSAEKITPILIIEEPESFLHPSAQAEFGRILQQVSTEFGVQVITTTHSPYMLNQASPESNILLERDTYRGQLRATQRIHITGDNWMEPFGVVLGISNEEFRPWREIFFSETKSYLLVEGKTDKEYFEMLRDEHHGDNRLDFEGEIFEYNGCENLKNPTLLRFVKSRSKAVVVTFDLDVATGIEPVLSRNGFEKNKTYMIIGKDVPGCRSIEGLLPDVVKDKVRSDNSALTEQAIHGTKDEQKSAKDRLKQLYLEEFKNTAKPGEEFFGEFYKLTKVLNKALS
jgi:predicted ATPase